MEFVIFEMDKNISKLSSEEKNFSENFDQIHSSVKPDISLSEVTNSLTQRDINVHEEIMPTQKEFVKDDITEIETNSVLLKNDGKEKYHQLIKESSFKISMKNSISLSSLSNEFQKSQASIDDGLLQEKCLQKSFSYDDIRLPSSTLSNILCHNVQTTTLNKCTELNKICNDEKETFLNSEFYMVTSETIPLEETITREKSKNSEIANIKEVENIMQKSDTDEKLVMNYDQTQALTNLIKHERDLCNDQQPCETIKNIKSQNNIIFRPTLVDDSRLVKISLPTNPINIMQSNAQFLNKSRNFLNFITEKSTNIMEKALLPQHLTMKYNSIIKSIDNTSNEKKYEEGSFSTEYLPTESASGNEIDSLTKVKNTSYITKSTMDEKGEKNKYIENDGNKNTFMTNSNENINLNIEENNKHISTNDHIFDKNNVDTIKLKNVKSESYSISDDIKKTNDNTLCAETNEDYHVNPMILNFKSRSSQESITDSIYQKEDKSFDFEESKSNLLQHPMYVTLLKDYADLKSKHLKLQEKAEDLEKQNQILETESKREIYSTQIETFEKTINRLTFELHTSLEAQETFKKKYIAANKERESMVMKYVVSEKQLIDTQRAREIAERKIKEITMQQEIFQSKLREMQGERTRMCNILSGKHREVTDLQKEVEKLREDVKMRDIKLQWAQNKLKTEMDLQKETQQKLDKAMTRINEMKEECELVRKETQETMRKFQRSEENKAVTLDQQLKEQQARLILERHVTEDKEMLRLQLQKEVGTLKHRQQILIEENNTLSLKIQDAEKNRLNYESNFNNLKIIADQRQKEVIELLSKVTEIETLKAQLQHKHKDLESTETEIQHLRVINEELQADISAYRQKEAEILDFTQKLTDKNVRLQSEFTAIEAKVKQLEKEHGPLHTRISELIDKVTILEESFAKEQKAKNEECEILVRRLAEQTQTIQNLVRQLEDSQGENTVLKRRQQISMKEMTRELQQCRKKLEAFETLTSYSSFSVASRTGSNISLNTGDTLNGALSDNNINGDQSIQPIEPSKQALIDRIIKLQESNIRKTEKLDFFEEHTRILVEELQKKKRIIQNYILHENIGAMGNNERDKYKAELARHGGIMASVYNQRVSDDNMTLELSLEINQKLQAVLEDALFKNITLKDNIDTLGEEIARLTIQNQQRQNTN